MIGEKSQCFKIEFKENPFKVGDILENSKEVQVKVIKTYNTWWRRILYKLGFKTKMMTVKVVQI